MSEAFQFEARISRIRRQRPELGRQVDPVTGDAVKIWYGHRRQWIDVSRIGIAGEEEVCAIPADDVDLERASLVRITVEVIR